MSGRIEAMTAASAAQSKRKNAPKEDEDDDSSDAGSDVVCPLFYFSLPKFHGPSHGRGSIYWGK
jgi:hypothetical protein